MASRADNPRPPWSGDASYQESDRGDQRERKRPTSSRTSSRSPRRSADADPKRRKRSESAINHRGRANVHDRFTPASASATTPYSFSLVEFEILNYATKASQTCQADQFLRDEAVGKPLEEVVVGDLDFTKFKRWCAEAPASFDPEIHSLYWVTRDAHVRIVGGEGPSKTEKQFEMGVNIQRSTQRVLFHLDETRKVERLAAGNWAHPPRPAHDHPAEAQGFGTQGLETQGLEARANDSKDVDMPDSEDVDYRGGGVGDEGAERDTLDSDLRSGLLGWKAVGNAADRSQTLAVRPKSAIDLTGEGEDDDEIQTITEGDRLKSVTAKALSLNFDENETIFLGRLGTVEGKEAFVRLKSPSDRQRFMQRELDIEKCREAYPRMVIPRLDFTQDTQAGASLPGDIHPEGGLLNHYSHGGNFKLAEGQKIELCTGGMDDEERMEELISGDDVCCQLTDELLEQAAEFFGADMELLKDRDVRVSVPGLNKPLLPPQLIAAFWSLRTLHDPANRLFTAAFIADGVGFGKTLTTLAILVANQHLTLATSGVKTNPSGHLQVDRNLTGQRCGGTPTAAFPCPCDPISVTAAHMLRGREGPVLIVVPRSILWHWAREIKAHISEPGGGGASRPVQLYIGYNSNQGTDRAIREAGLQGLAVMLTQENARDFHPQEDEQGRLRPRRGQNCKWIITTPGSLDSQVLRKLRDKPSGSKTPAETPYAAFSAVVVDEWHLIKGADTALMANLRSLPDHPWYLWLSATPFEKSVGELMGPVIATLGDRAVKVGSDWKLSGELEDRERDELGRVDPERLKSISSNLKPLDKQDVQDEPADGEKRWRMREALDHSTALIKAYLIRRTPGSEHYGKPAVKIPWQRVWDYILPWEPGPGLETVPGALDRLYRKMEERMTRELAARQEKWRAKPEAWKMTNPMPTKTNEITFKNAGREARQAASFPYLAVLMEMYPDVKFDADMAKELVREGKSHWLWAEHHELLVSSSAKLRFVRKMVEKKMRKRSGYNGNPLKVLLFTFDPLLAALYHLWIVEYLRESATLVHADLNSEERMDAVVQFQEEPTPQWLVGRPEILGHGHSCTKAYHSFAMEPSFTTKEEKQLQGRTNRTAMVQLAKVTFCYRLSLQGNRVEAVIKQRHIKRDGGQPS